MADNQPQKPLIMVDPHWFEGVPYPGAFSQKTLESLKHTQVYDDDIYVAAYPKSGISFECLLIYSCASFDSSSKPFGSSLFIFMFC